MHWRTSGIYQKVRRKKNIKVPVVKNCFINPHIQQDRQTLKDFLQWKMGYLTSEEEKHAYRQSFDYPKINLPFTNQKPAVTWINHSTFLVKAGGIHFLTDPIWSERCSPLPFLGFRRRHAPGIAFSELPQIDFVIISHDHYDHLDRKTVLDLSQRFPNLIWFVPKGVKAWFDRQNISPVCEMGWWEELKLCLPKHPWLTLAITAVPSQHFSGRRGYDFNRTLWTGYVLEIAGKRCYFVGDTGYNSIDFKQIGECFAPIDLSLIPIGAYTPRQFMQPVHVNPREAVQIHKQVGSRFSIGMHWKTFSLADEPMEQPPHDLYQALIAENIDPSEFVVVEPGQDVNW